MAGSPLAVSWGGPGYAHPHKQRTVARCLHKSACLVRDSQSDSVKLMLVASAFTSADESTYSLLLHASPTGTCELVRECDLVRGTECVNQHEDAVCWS